MRIAVTTEFDEAFSSVSEITIPIMEEWCFRHQYKFFKRTKPTQSKGIVLERCRHMKDVAECGNFDWVWHFDADVLITNTREKLEPIINRASPCLVVIAKTLDGSRGGWWLNDGVFGATGWAASVLGNAINDMEPHLKFLQDFMLMGDTGYMRGIRELTSVVPQQNFNSFLYPEYGLPETTPGNWKAGDFVLHLPGMTNERRVELLNYYKSLIVR